MTVESTDFFISGLLPLEEGDGLAREWPKTLEPTDEWPLHVTLVPYFSVPERYEGAFSNSVSNLMRKTRPITIIGGEEDFFGENEDVRVRLVHSTGSLAMLHEKLCGLIWKYDGTIDSKWIHNQEGYRSHVTATSTDELHQGEMRTLTNIQRIREIGGRGMVIASYPLLGNEGMA